MHYSAAPCEPAKTSAGCRATHQYVLTLTVHTNTSNSATIRGSRSATSTTIHYPMVVIPKDGQHQFISAVVEQVKNTTLPWAGTPAWRELDDADPRKLLSLAIAGEHHVLRVEIGQEQRAQAAEDVWGGADWSEAARQLPRRREIDRLREAS